jgi:hypothetical protein
MSGCVTTTTPRSRSIPPDVPVEIVNLARSPRWNKLDFGPVVDPLNPYHSDGNNVAPRVGFAWTVPHMSDTVIRGGRACCSARTCRHGARERRESVRALPHDLDQIGSAAKGSNGRCTPMTRFRLSRRTPRATSRLLRVQHRSAGAVHGAVDVSSGAQLRQDHRREVGYLRTDGRDFPLQDPFPGLRSHTGCDRIRHWAPLEATTSAAIRRWSTTRADVVPEALLQPLLL